ncbi:hypothetical protein FNV43_RR24828 [Rhamnella rubrinervis]|uniref:CASP-like protein n=1 Tax=Rhamnella rubrinervis TaxID=2594499 RepID=A0A8K0DTV5_9ROSA|nr:hypothetical protein FNV43_RR24828 [Rhamnella rubrinervis]
MAQSAASRICNLVLRIVTLVLLLISLIVLTTNSKTIEVSLGAVRLRFQDVYAYKYVLATIIIGIIYILLQVGLSIFQVISSGDGYILFDFYGDKFMSYMLATGSAAGFGVTLDMKQLYMLSMVVIGIPYTLFQIGISIYHFVIKGHTDFLIDFYRDKNNCSVHAMEAVMACWEIEQSLQSLTVYGEIYFRTKPVNTTNHKLVHNWHRRGGTVLETSRGGFDLNKIVDVIQDRGFNQVSLSF